MTDNDLAPEHRLAALQRAQSDVLRLQGECARLRKDSTRYHWLLESATWEQVVALLRDTLVSEAGAAIDAAMAGQGRLGAAQRKATRAPARKLT